MHPRSELDGLISPPVYDIDPKRQIYFVAKSGYQYDNAKLLVKISRNFKKLCLAFGKDSYELREKDGEYTQRLIQWLNKKQVAFIRATENEFIFVVHKDFDKSYEIRTSKSELVKIKIPERIAPGSNQRIISLQQSLDIDEETALGSKMVVITSRDSNFSYHEV